ncbi:MAG: TrmH family RNA methyltransferase [Bacteroidota bacterium]
MKSIPHVSKAQLKYCRSLTQKKIRQAEGKFIIEGARLLEEALQAKYPVEPILMTQEFLNKAGGSEIDKLITSTKTDCYLVSEKELAAISDTVHSQGIVAIVPMRESSQNIFWEKLPPRSILVALEYISDPGNLGTILRTCDWFGVDGVFLSNDTVELYSPKVIRSTMGAIFHIPIFSDCQLRETVSNAKKHGSVIIGTTLVGGKNAFQYTVPEKSLIIFGSEARGLTNETTTLVDTKLTIPKFGKAESLNVASSCAVMLSLIRSK